MDNPYGNFVFFLKCAEEPYFLFFDVGILYVPQGIQYGKHRDPRNYQENTHQSVQGNS